VVYRVRSAGSTKFYENDPLTLQLEFEKPSNSQTDIEGLEIVDVTDPASPTPVSNVVSNKAARFIQA